MSLTTPYAGRQGLFQFASDSSANAPPCPLDPPEFAVRQDLFQKPQKTLTELRKRHANLRLETIARPVKPAWPAMAHVERTVFSNPRTMRPAPDTAGLEILAGGRQIGEIELIGRRIKRLLLEGDHCTHHAPRDGHHHAERDEYVRPGQIAVVFRRPQALADLVSEVFQRLEIPFFLENGRSLGRWPPIVMLLRLLELDADDWPMHKLLGVLGSNYFAPDWADWNDRAAGLAERTIREPANSPRPPTAAGASGTGCRERPPWRSGRKEFVAPLMERHGGRSLQPCPGRNSFRP